MIIVNYGSDNTAYSHYPEELVEDLLIRIVDATGMDLINGYLLINGSNVHTVCTVHMEMRVADLNVERLTYRGVLGGAPRACHWVDYIDSSSIQYGERNVGWWPSMKITFKPFKPYALYHKIDCHSLRVTRSRSAFQNLWTRYWDPSIDKNYRFTDRFNTRPLIMLLELSCAISEIDQIRYNITGCNASYCGGEYDSWQRYTRKIPIDCKYATTETSISIIPSRPLTPNVWHALVLLNMPIFIQKLTIHDDYLIPFLPNDVSSCRRACLAFIHGMQSRSSTMRMTAKIICRVYIWPFRFDDCWAPSFI